MNGGDRMIPSAIDNDEPCYVISVAAKMVGMHQQTLRYYERAGVIEPSRSRGNIRLYSQSDIARLRQIQQLIGDFGVNLAGAEVILKLRDHIVRLEQEIEGLRQQLAAARLELRSDMAKQSRKSAVD
jgi:MerR family transcriptional regulator, heat shock protein HspR